MTVDNLELRCRAHNALAAEQDFGRDHMDWMRGVGKGPAPAREDSSELISKRDGNRIRPEALAESHGASVLRAGLSRTNPG